MTFIKLDKATVAFILIFIISWINPELIYNLNKFYIGKLIILMIIIFFSSENIILGLLAIFIYFAILDEYRYVIEGMTNEEQIITKDTIGEIKQDNPSLSETEGKEKSKKTDKIIISTENSNTNGVDIQDIRDSIASKDSNTLPLSKNMFKSSEDVEPFNNRS
jgi:hypothetical protein